MKVDKNSPTYPYAYKDLQGCLISNEGIPLRLEIAARLLAAQVSNSDTDFSKVEKNIKEISELFLEFSDKLIEAHNETCEGE